MGKQSDPLYTIIPSYRTVDDTLGLCRGPRRVVCFCCLGVIFPAVLISIPLLMRFVVYGNSTYFMSASDMMILDHRISTIWCQREWVKMNGSFTAYVTDEEPKLIKSPKPLTITKTLIIPDDHKEYWGFYLLKGSAVSLLTCSKFKGATVLIVKGRSHLHHCAYIGNEDSTGNSDEHSDSNSIEAQRLSPHSVRRITNGTASYEEMSHLLKQIRTYIKTHPRGYHHLQKNLFGIFHTNETVRRRRRSTSNIESGKIYRNKRHRIPRFVSDANVAAEEDLEYNESLKSENNKINISLSSTSSVISSQHHTHTGIFNLTTYNDGSNSESESSFSSSEEALAKCEGIMGIFNLNRTETCGMGDFNFNFNISITESGFYYFIFGSENEKTSNLLHINLAVEKFEYDLPLPLTNCTNVRKCEVSFQFGSSQKLVVSIPSAQGETWDDVYFVETDCVPRTSIYLIFILMVPFVILVCAFQ